MQGSATTTSLAANQSTGPYTESTYNGLTSTFRDERGYVTTRTSNAAARTITVTEPNAAATIYTNDRLGRLAGVTDSAANVTLMTYDLLGRKLTMNDPDMGAWTYTYDAAGNLKTQTDARFITTTLNYDVNQRLTQKAFSNGLGDPFPTVTYRYDSYTLTSEDADAPPCSNPSGFLTEKGMMTRMIDGAGKQFGCYDQRGRGTLSRRTINGDAPGTYYDITTNGYNRLNQPTQVTYPSGSDVVTYTYSPTGNLIQMQSQVGGTIFSGATPKPWGALATMTLGNGQEQTYSYDFRTRVTGIQAGPSGAKQNLVLTYDEASNVLAVTDSVGTSETVSYTPYDHLNRLTGGSGFGGTDTAAYVYNPIGNVDRKREGSSGTTHDLTLCYGYASAPKRPHAVTSVYNSGTATCGSGTPWMKMVHDSNGNQIIAGNHAYEFDHENRVTRVLETQSAAPPAAGFLCVDQNGDGGIDLADALINTATVWLKSWTGWIWRLGGRRKYRRRSSGLPPQQCPIWEPLPGFDGRLYVRRQRHAAEARTLQCHVQSNDRQPAGACFVDGLYRRRLREDEHGLGDAVLLSVWADDRDAQGRCAALVAG